MSAPFPDSRFFSALRRFRWRSWIAAGAATLWLFAVGLATGCIKSKDTAGNTAAASLPHSSFPERFAAVNPQRCLPCHEQETRAWRQSQHAVANRPVDPAVDRAKFAAVVAGLSPYTPEAAAAGLRIAGPGEDTAGAAVGVIGVGPLIQFLLARDDGRFQAHELAFDPARQEWFNLFGVEERRPGEWGHWSGQGMNWNSNCAWCHLTEFRKNYDAAADTYASTWLAQGVSCQQCHPNSAEHTLAAEAGRTVAADRVPHDPQVAMHNCASCHARREQLTPDGFAAGDSFHDHFGLVLPDAPGVYFPDGQNRDENYVFGSLMLSRMGHAGVTCADCHDPHSHATILPVENNALCIRCHATGERDAPVIDLALHSRHPAGSTGDQCVACHMPPRTYMARDPRRDHGFTSPDPALSRELGTPDACSACHSDQPVEWSIQHADAWYDTPSRETRRERARLLAAAQDLERGFPLAALQAAATDTDNAYWKATWLRLLAEGPDVSGLQAWAQDFTTHREPIVRAAAVRLLGRAGVSEVLLQLHLADGSRLVRREAIAALAPLGPLPAAAQADQALYLEAHADRPAGALERARDALARGEVDAARRHVERAVSFDRLNPMLYFQGALLLDSSGQVDPALELLWSAPTEARATGHLHYAEGLLWAEKGELHRSVAALRQAVERDPSQDRWWYNLALAETKLPDWLAAQDAVSHARRLAPDALEYRQLAAIIEQQLRQ